MLRFLEKAGLFYVFLAATRLAGTPATFHQVSILPN